jgi:uncharacterized delta-60 repeat protein
MFDCLTAYGRRRTAAIGWMMALVLMLASASVAFAADGDLDLTFGIGGTLRTTIPGVNNAVGNAIATQADGKIVVAMTVVHFVTPAESKTAIGVVRYNQNGSLDTTFNGAGWSFTNGVRERARDIALQSDGKIVVGGNSTDNFDNTFLLVRFNADGTQDLTFGTGGKVTTNLSSGIENLNAIAVSADDTIVSVGGAEFPGTAQDFVVMRHLADGTLDTTFGGGVVVTPLGNDGEEVTGVAIQADGRIVATGPRFSTAPEFAVVRYLDDGSLDPAFGNSGVVLISETFGVRSEDVLIQPDQHIVVGGHAANSVGAQETFLIRFGPDGTLDSSFGIGGTAKGLPGLIATEFALQADGKILATGRHEAGFPPNFAFKVGRFTTQGLVDFSFGILGIVTTDLTPNVTTEGSEGVAVQADGKIVLAGSASSDIALVRYHSTPPPTPPIAFFLHGDDAGLPQAVSGQFETAAGGGRGSHPGGPQFVMSLTPPTPQTLTVRLADAPSWRADRTLAGAFLPGAGFLLRVPCAQAIPGQKIARVFTIDRNGHEQQVSVAAFSDACKSSMLFKLPLGTTAPLFADKLSLRVSLQGAFNGVDVDIPLGPDTFFNISGFAGTLQTPPTP